MKPDLDDLKKTPSWILLFAMGALCIILGASSGITIASNKIALSSPLNFIVLGLGAVFIAIGFVDYRSDSAKARTAELPVKQIVVSSIDVDQPGRYPRARITGRVVPPKPGVRVWILREHYSKSPGRFHIGEKPALTDKNGDWQQFTNLWGGGSFRLHAVIASQNAEILYSYYRKAFESARKVYRQKVDADAASFPYWPHLDSLPDDCISDYQVLSL